MARDLDAAELKLLSQEAGEFLLAGLAHRFEAPEQMAINDDGLPFIGHALAGTVVRAALEELCPLLRQITARATFRRRHERAISTDPVAGQLDLGRSSLASLDVGAWPIIRMARSHDTPENAVLSAALREINSWGSTNAKRFSSWTGAELFSRVAAEAGRLRRGLRSALGDIQLEHHGAAQLLPLAWERLALGKASSRDYGRALELVETVLGAADPRRRLGRALHGDWTVKAIVGGLNEAALQNTAFELWVASRFAKHCKELGFQLAFPHESGEPLVMAVSGDRTMEIWWQSARPIADQPSSLDHQTKRADGTWTPLSLRPDLVLVSRRPRSTEMLCVECKNKDVEAPSSTDLAQVFGYLTHYGRLEHCVLAYRNLETRKEYRRASTHQCATALAAPLRPKQSTGDMLHGLLSGGAAGSHDPHQ